LLASPKKAFTSGLSITGSPLMTAGYNYVAKLGIATMGLSPTRSANSFAAPGLSPAKYAALRAALSFDPKSTTLVKKRRTP